MISDRQHNVFDLDMVAGLVTGVLLLLIAVIIFIGSQIGVRVIAQLPADRTLGPYGVLSFVFTEPVDGSLTIARFSIQPPVKGKFQWADSKTLHFIPIEPYQYGTVYTLAFTPGPLTSTGSVLKKTRSWKFQIRQPLVVYLMENNTKRRLWTIERDSGNASPLTDDSFNIYNFDASRNGEFVIFAAINAQNGIDLWRINRMGGNAVRLLPCSADRCASPVISPDNRRLAYIREAAGPTPDLPYGAPRIRVLDMETKQDAPLYEDQQIIGINPAWSPDGTRLSSYDGGKKEYRLLDLITGSQATIPSQTGDTVTWSADGSTFVFTDLDTNEFGLHTRIREAKLITTEITTLFGDKDERDYKYNSLAWSPIDDTLIIGLRPNADDPAEALWLMRPATLDGQATADQPGYVYNDPIWDPWGTGFIFSQFKLKGAYKPEIGIWMQGSTKPRLLVADGLLPHWLP